jgi:hypothetical protein
MLAYKLNIKFNGLEVQVHIGMQVDILFGLELFTVFFILLKEVFMNNLNAIFQFAASVWCGIAFLRSLAEIFQPKRKMDLYEDMLPAKSER